MQYIANVKEWPLVSEMLIGSEKKQLEKKRHVNCKRIKN